MAEQFSIDLDAICNRNYRVIERIDPKETAMIVVDMQGFFLKPGQPAYLPGGEGAPSAEQVIDASVRAVDLCRKHGIQVIWSKWGLRGDGWDVGLWGRLWPTWQAGTPEGPSWDNPASGIVDELQPAAGEPVFEKSRYSSFWGTPLDTWLRHLPQIDTLVMIGVTTGFCVRYTVEDAFSRDYKVLVLADCTTAINDPVSPDHPGSGQYIAALRDFSMGLGDVMTVDELEQELERASVGELVSVGD